MAVEDSAGGKQKTARAKSNMRGDEAAQDKKVTAAAAAGSSKTLEPPESGVKIKKSKSPANEVQSPAKQAEIPDKK